MYAAVQKGFVKADNNSLSEKHKQKFILNCPFPPCLVWEFSCLPSIRMGSELNLKGFQVLKTVKSYQNRVFIKKKNRNIRVTRWGYSNQAQHKKTKEGRAQECKGS